MKRTGGILARAVILIAFILLIRWIVIYFLTDEPLWESPYDRNLMDQEIVFELANDNLDLLLSGVGEYVEKWTGEQNLISCNVKIDNEGVNTHCSLVYYSGKIKDYKGICNVMCYFKGEKWVMANAEEQYTLDDSAPNFITNIQSVQEKYKNVLAFINENAFSGATDYWVCIGADRTYITIFGVNDSNDRCIIKTLELE